MQFFDCQFIFGHYGGAFKKSASIIQRTNRQCITDATGRKAKYRQEEGMKEAHSHTMSFLSLPSAFC